jgi:hypothetical protein
MANTLKLGNGKWATGKDTLLSFSDTNNNYKPLPFSFSRASSGTVVNKDGLIETVGVGEPRIDFKDNTKGALLLEPERRNIFDYSSNLSAWSKLNSTVTESSVLSLDGINNSYAYERTSSSASYIYRTVSLSNTTDYTLSFFVKSGTSTNFTTDIWDTTQSTQCQIKIDLVTKTVSNFIGNSYKIEDYTNGWMRVSVTFTSESSFGTTFNRYFNSDSVGTELYIWGVQLEEGSYATSYIPTSGSAVTRVVDTCIQTVPEGIVDENEMTLYCELEYIGGASIIAMSVHNNSNSVIWLNIEADLTVSGANFYGGFYGVSRSTTSLELNNKYKIAYRTKNGDSALYINGILEASSTETIANPNILNKVQLGGFWTSANTEGNFKIIDAKCYNSGLSNSELQALTQ